MSERLEEFKKEIDFLDDSADMQDHGRFVDTCLNLYEDGWFHWITRYAKEQAEQVERLKVKNTKLKNQKRKFMDKATWQRKEKQRYRKALKFYADEDNYEHDVVEMIDGVYGVSNCEILNDEGETAIEALESESE